MHVIGCNIKIDTVALYMQKCPETRNDEDLSIESPTQNDEFLFPPQASFLGKGTGDIALYRFLIKILLLFHRRHLRENLHMFFT